MVVLSHFVCALVWTGCLTRSQAFRFRAPPDSLSLSGQELFFSGKNREAQNQQSNLLHQVLQGEAKKTADCKRRATEVARQAASPIPSKEKLRQQCLAQAQPGLLKVPFTHRRQVEKQMQVKCEEEAEEQRAQLQEKQKRARDTAEQCDDLLQGTVNGADEAAQKTRSLQASALGYDLTDLEKTMSPEVARALRAAYAEAEGCDHDYSLLCPFSWIEGSDGSTCTAPGAYIGPCEKTQRFALSKDEKQGKERECLVTWPCLKKCVRDYTQLCPSGWTEAGGGRCSAPFSYSGRCSRTSSFSELSQQERERWSAACDAYWPCQAPCKRDFSAPCPDGWTSIGGEGKCKAPEGYVGPCGPVESIGSLDSETKLLFEKKCNVLFPCERKCARDYSFACPVNWRNVALEKCSPGESYAGPCREEVDFTSQTLQDKVSFEENCLADWPCIEEKCERDFTAPCPLEWAEAHKACMSPAHYEGPCEERQDFVSLTPEEKAAAMETCEVFWPCKGGEALLRDMVQGGPAEGRGVSSLFGGPVESATGKVIGFQP